MSQQNPLNDLTDSSMSKLRSLVDVNTIIGDPITTADGITIIPISKVSFGYASGGSDLPTEAPEKFAGGSGGGVTLQPLGFLVINGADIRLLQLQTADNTGDRLVNAGAGAIDRILDLIPQKDKKNKSEKTATKETVEDIENNMSINFDK